MYRKTKFLQVFIIVVLVLSVSLVNVERVAALIGAAASGVSISVAQSVSIPNQVPQVSNASTSPLITFLPADEGQDFLFRTCPSDALQGFILGKIAVGAG